MSLGRDDRQNISESGLTIESSIPDWIIEHPETYQFFLDLGLNTFCGGTSLQYELEKKGLNPARVLKELAATIESASKK